MENYKNLPPLRDVIKKYRLSAKKNLSQSFILDMNMTHKIASAGGTIKGENIVEIGPGPGGLTRAIIEQGANHVFAVEKDQRAIQALNEIECAYPGKLTVIQGDARKREIQKYIKENAQNASIIANLPYHIATQLLINWLSESPWPPWYKNMTLMFQKEVAQRITAKHNNKNFGRLTILAQWRCKTKYLFEINPATFTPKPKVTSALIYLEPKNNTHNQNPKLKTIEEITKAAFAKRRKIIRTTLKKYIEKNKEILQKAEISETARAEEIPIEKWISLATLYEKSL